ncbi:hypothetical protein V8G54_018111 [Vigna mungo]|uniref:Uncharacterized protein n=1 Tax=Vigna mungo TaxID=3915 RepID=A0AAQ3N9D0_VIGMU
MPFGDKYPVVIFICSIVVLEALSEFLEEILHQHTPKCRPICDDNPIGLYNDRLLFLEKKRISHRAVVVKNGPSKQVCIRRLHNLSTEGSAHSTPISSNEMRMVLWNLPFS